MSERHEFNRPHSGFLELFVFVEPILYSVVGVMMIWKFGISSIFDFEGTVEVIGSLILVGLVVAYNVWVLFKPSVVIEDGVLSIIKPYRTKDIQLNSIVKADVDQTFYIYYKRTDGKEDGCYLPVRKESFETLYSLIF